MCIKLQHMHQIRSAHLFLCMKTCVFTNEDLINISSRCKQWPKKIPILTNLIWPLSISNAWNKGVIRYILKVFTLYLQNNQTNLLVPKHSSTWKYLSIYYIFVTKSSNKIHTVLLYFTHIEQRHLGQMIWRPFLNHKSSWNSAPLSPKQKKVFCQNEKVIK